MMTPQEEEVTDFLKYMVGDAKARGSFPANEVSEAESNVNLIVKKNRLGKSDAKRYIRLCTYFKRRVEVRTARRADLFQG